MRQARLQFSHQGDSLIDPRMAFFDTVHREYEQNLMPILHNRRMRLAPTRGRNDLAGQG